MRSPVDRTKLEQLLRELGRRSKGPGRIYIVGGGSALLEGWREATVDVDLKLDPEPRGVFELIAKLKDEMDLNIELSAPDQFLPAVPQWRERSKFIARYGEVDFLHYDFRAQALSKLARGFDRDIRDVESMLSRNLVSLEDLLAAFDAIRPDLIRFPGVDESVIEDRLDALENEG